MSFTLRPLESGDAEAWARLAVAANTDPLSDRPGGEFMDTMWPGLDTPFGVSLFTKNLAARLEKPPPTLRMRKAVDDETGQIASIAMWVKEQPPMGDPAPVGDEWFGRDFSSDVEERKRGKEYAQRVASALFERRKRQVEQWGGVTVVLQSLATLPEYQRRGAAALHMQDGVDWADSLDAQVIVDASTQAKKLYENFGLELEEHVTRPEPPHEWKGRVSSSYDFRVRPAKSTREARRS